MLVFDLTACQYVGTSVVHGGGEYGKVVFDKLISERIVFACVYNAKMSIDQYYINQCTCNRIKYYDYHKYGLVPTLKSINCTTFYSALPYRYGKDDFGGIRFLGTIHGLRDLEVQSDKCMHLYGSSFKEIVKLRIKESSLYKKYAIRRNYSRLKYLFLNNDFRYIVVSEHTKYAIISFFPNVEYNNIKVLYSPSISKPSTHLDSENKFYLIISGDRWIKNPYRALVAIDNLISKGLINHDTIITGACPRSILSRLHNKNKFKFLPYVSDQELNGLMRKAYCFIYPSLNEGFGYPPLQAMSCGTPIIASAVCSIPEICGQGVLYFNPLNILEIENRLLQIEDDRTRQKLVEEGYKRFDFISNRQDEDLNALIAYMCNEEK